MELYTIIWLLAISFRHNLTKQSEQFGFWSVSWRCSWYGEKYSHSIRSAWEKIRLWKEINRTTGRRTTGVSWHDLISRLLIEWSSRTWVKPVLYLNFHLTKSLLQPLITKPLSILLSVTSTSRIDYFLKFQFVLLLCCLSLSIRLDVYILKSVFLKSIYYNFIYYLSLSIFSYCYKTLLNKNIIKPSPADQ